MNGIVEISRNRCNGNGGNNNGGNGNGQGDQPAEPGLKLHRDKPVVLESELMREIVQTALKLRCSDIPVLVIGESGTGKEVIARAIHQYSIRANRMFIGVNCAALPEQLIESELFGSLKGAYTGSTAERRGLFREAENGTLYLDEVSEMHLAAQAKLLRVLQEGRVRPVGGTVEYKVNCRVISSTNRPLDEAIRTGKLRPDLMHRLNGMIVKIPPLRDRPDDILPLAEGYMRFWAAEENKEPNGFTEQALDALMRYSWPGNVRELENTVRRGVLLANNHLIDVCHLRITPEVTEQEKVSEQEAEAEGVNILEREQRGAIVKMLRVTGGNKFQTAKRLGISRQTLYRKIEAFGIKL